MINRVVAHEDLMDECQSVQPAKSALLSQVGVKMTKQAVNRALEGMGFLSTLQHNLELMVHFETSTSPEQEAFNAIRAGARTSGRPGLEGRTVSRPSTVSRPV